MIKPNVFKLLLALALLAGAGLIFFRFLREDDGILEKTFFYDLHEKKLFAASREAVDRRPAGHACAARCGA